jgi:hypothetical protein
MANHVAHVFNCGHRLADIVTHPAAALDLAEHYRKEPELQELVVRYEDLVSDQQPVTQRLLDHAGLARFTASSPEKVQARYDRARVATALYPPDPNVTCSET